MKTLTRMLLILGVLGTGYSAAALTIALGDAWWVVPAGILVYRARRIKRPSLWAFGTSRWACRDDVKEFINAKEGFVLGQANFGKPSLLKAGLRLFHPRVSSLETVNGVWAALPRSRTPSAILWLKGALHTVTFIPSGGGKNQSLIFFFMQSCRDSILATDFKSENLRATRDHRLKMGQRVIVLDPFGTSGVQSDNYNPLSTIDSNCPSMIDDARALAEALVRREPGEKEKHFNDSCEIVIAAMIVSVCLFASPEDRSLQTVRSVIADQAKFTTAISLLRSSAAFDGLVARIGDAMTQYQGKELGSIQTTVSRHLNFLDSHAVFQNTKQSSFDASLIATEPTTIYLCLPPEFIRSQSALLRMWITALMREIIKNGLSNRPFHIIADESYSIGHLPQMADALAIGRAYGIRLHHYYQSRAQLDTCWPDGAAETLLANSTQIYAGISSFETAEAVSKRLGDATETHENWGANKGGSRGRNDDGSPGNASSSWGSDVGTQQVARALLQPAEVMALDPRIAISFVPGKPPIMTRLLRMYETPNPENLTASPSFFARLKLTVGSVLFFVLTAMTAVILMNSVERRSTPQSTYHAPFKKVKR